MLSCEHASRRVPAEVRAALRGAAQALASHRGWDPGALVLARHLAHTLGAPLVAAGASRLVVDPNRSEHHPQLFSEWTRSLPDEQREALLARHWRPHRARVEALVRAALAEHKTVLHVSVHSFTPRWEGRPRTVDVGLLYDPSRRRERELAARWLAALAERRPELRLRRNQPYRGTADGLTTHLRQRLGPRYLGLEIEVSQRFPLGARDAWLALQRDLSASLRAALGRAAPLRPERR